MRNLRAVPGPNQASYEELYKAHYARVLRLCRLLLADPHEAEEVGQEVFLKMFQVYEAQNWPAAWGPWVTRVAVNACHDRRRSGWWKWWRTSGQEFQETDYPNRGRTPEEEVVGQEERGRIWRSFRELSARQQEVFILRHLEEWSTEEVAKTLGISSGSVKRHLFRAVCHLRKVLGGRL